ncbi:60S ribosomal protein L12-1 [Forsythia ovata]|uniref:60S ribosomal protein L12-1 n=1 Tax=Forsythia ovata TaxID=205694 RepID=A0ABD1QAG3_9LAMI
MDKIESNPRTTQSPNPNPRISSDPNSPKCRRPKFDPTQVVDVFTRVTSGEVGAASSHAPKIDPPGPSSKKIGENIAKETARDWKGLHITVKLTVQNRQSKVTVVPSAAALVIKALKEPKRDQKKTKNIKHNDSISLDDVIEIAKVISMAKDLSSTDKEILETCVSVECTVDGKDPKNLQQEIIDGDVEIPERLLMSFFG